MSNEDTKLYEGPNKWRYNYMGAFADIEHTLELLEEGYIEEAKQHTRITCEVMQSVLVKNGPEPESHSK